MDRMGGFTFKFNSSLNLGLLAHFLEIVLSITLQHDVVMLTLMDS